MNQTENINVTPQPQENVSPQVEVPRRSSGGVVAFLVILVLALLGFIAYMFFTDRLDIGIENPLSEKDSVTQEEDDTDVQNDSEYVLKNTGWAVFNLPEYGFSAEIPSYTMKQDVDGTDVESIWKAGFEETDFPRANFFDNYLNTVFIKFIPDDVSMFACGEGCVKEHIFSVDVFENTESKSLSEVKGEYFTNWKDNEEGVTITEKSEQKWDMDVVSFNAGFEAGDITGYVVVTDEHVYVVSYYISSSPSESESIAEKVLDSFVFGR